MFPTMIGRIVKPLEGLYYHLKPTALTLPDYVFGRTLQPSGELVETDTTVIAHLDLLKVPYTRVAIFGNAKSLTPLPDGTYKMRGWKVAEVTLDHELFILDESRSEITLWDKDFFCTYASRFSRQHKARKQVSLSL